MTSEGVPSGLVQDLEAQHLIILGHCATTPDDSIGPGTLLMIGPDEPHFWRHFTQSPEYSDGQPDALDRWSQRTLATLAQTRDATAIFPFGGAPYHPFYSWALRTGRFWASPIGFLVHDTRGLFASFRGALLISEDLTAHAPSQSPCQTCHAPCKTTCPVGAFADGYDVPACKAHLSSPKGTPCMSHGCQARATCPVGQGLRQPAQAAFHMTAFR
jgi:hypothetical protein